MINFSSWIIFGAAANAGEVQGSAMIINLFFGTILNATFGIANQVNTLVKMFSQSLTQAVVPQITKSYSSGNNNRIMQLVIFSSKYSFLLMLIPSLPFLLETDSILKLWLKNVPFQTAIFVQLMISNALITTANAGIQSAVQATGNVKYFQIVLGTLTLLGLPVAYVFFLMGYPAYVIILIYTFIAIVSFFVKQFFLRRLFQSNLKEFYYKSHLKLLMIILAVTPIFFIKNMLQPSFSRLIFISILSTIWLIFAIYYIGMDKNERLLVKAFLSGKPKANSSIN